MCLVSRDKIPQLCVSRNPNENVASVKRESRFRVSEDPLTRSISIQPLSSTIVSLRKDRRAEICPTPGRSTNRIRSECPHPSIVISSTARIIRSVRLNKTIVRATKFIDTDLLSTAATFRSTETIFDHGRILSHAIEIGRVFHVCTRYIQ